MYIQLYIQLQPRRPQAFDGRSERESGSGLVASVQDVRGEVKLYILKECLQTEGSWDATPTGYGGAHEQ
jgi:hypothetical protein